ncbi:MAG: DUF3732 domain-containing protein [Lachnospiraceae bacterium]
MVPNWVGVHLIAYFALQYYFIEFKSPGSKLSVFDQPSQVYIFHPSLMKKI